MGLPVFTAAGEPSRQISGAMPTSAPAAVTMQGAVKEAHGRVGENGTVTIEVDKACVVTLYTFSPASNTWKPPGSSAASYTKTFSAAGKDYFMAHPGVLFFLKSDTASTTGFIDGDPAQGYGHG